MPKAGKYTEVGCKTAEMGRNRTLRSDKQGFRELQRKTHLSASELFTSLFWFFKTVSHYVAQNQLKM